MLQELVIVLNTLLRVSGSACQLLIFSKDFYASRLSPDAVVFCKFLLCAKINKSITEFPHSFTH